MLTGEIALEIWILHRQGLSIRAIACVDPVAGVCIRAHIRATFTGPPHVRVTGRNRHGARDWLAERLATILDARHAPYAPEGADLPPDLPPDLA